MLLHTMKHWSRVIALIYWPFVFSYTKPVNNSPPCRSEEKCLTQLFIDEDNPHHPQDYYVWGSPAYILSKAIQNGKATGKFSKD